MTFEPTPMTASTNMLLASTPIGEHQTLQTNNSFHIGSQLVKSQLPPVYESIQKYEKTGGSFDDTLEFKSDAS